MARRGHDCPSCSRAVGRHQHRLRDGRTVFLCDVCEEFAAYVLPALMDDDDPTAPAGHYPVTADDHDSAAWPYAA